MNSAQGRPPQPTYSTTDDMFSRPLTGHLEEGEILRTYWPHDAGPEAFGPTFTEHSFGHLQEEAGVLDIRFKMKSRSSVKRKRQSDRQVPAVAVQQPYLLQLIGPVGSTRSFYAQIREIMACKRKSWKGLRHPRKVDVNILSEAGVGETLASTSSASAADDPTRAAPGEDPDDSDDADPPTEDHLRHLRLSALSPGEREPAPDDSVRGDRYVETTFPNQGGDIDENMSKAFAKLCAMASDYWEVTARNVPHVGEVCSFQARVHECVNEL